MTYSQFLFSGKIAFKPASDPPPAPGVAYNKLILNSIFPEQKLVKAAFGQAERGLSSSGQELSTELSTGSVDKMNSPKQRNSLATNRQI